MVHDIAIRVIDGDLERPISVRLDDFSELFYEVRSRCSRVIGRLPLAEHLLAAVKTS